MNQIASQQAARADAYAKGANSAIPGHDRAAPSESAPGSGQSTESAAATEIRWPAIDYIKAAAILAVVATHAASPTWRSVHTALEHAVHAIVQFHVPAFFLVSGFLYAGGRTTLQVLARRLSRLIFPYVIASGVAIATGVAKANTIEEVSFGLLTGSAIGIYYFVFLMVIYVLLSWPLSKVSRPTVALALIAVCAYATICTIEPRLALREGLFWALRNPVHTVGYFLAGWVARSYRHELKRLFYRGAPVVIGMCAVGLVIHAAAQVSGVSPRVSPTFRAVYTISIVTLVIAWAIKRSSVPSAPVRFLSQSTYAIFLYHYLFQAPFVSYFSGWGDAVRIPALLGTGLFASVALVTIATRLLGPRWARLVFGI